MIERASFEMEVGFLMCGSLRDFLKRKKFTGMDIEWYEGPGILNRNWIIKGKKTDVLQLYTELKQKFGK